MPVLRYLGHSACEVRDGATRVLFDPFLTGNPLAPAPESEFNPTAILITHGHNDHIGDTEAIARRSGALVVANHEIATYMQGRGLNAHGMSTGGAFTFPWGWVKLTQAWHGSTFVDASGAVLPMGTPAGILLRVGGKLLYHAGDTALFGDMAYIGRQEIDVALLPVGDNYTMGPEDALEAVHLLKPRVVVPIHYNTFGVIRQDAAAWAERVTAETSSAVVVLKPGEELDY